MRRLSKLFWTFVVINSICFLGWMLVAARGPRTISLDVTGKPLPTQPKLDLRPTPTTAAPELKLVSKNLTPPVVSVWERCYAASNHEVILSVNDLYYPTDGIHFYVNHVYDRQDKRGPREEDRFHASARDVSVGDLYVAIWNTEEFGLQSSSCMIIN